VLTRAIVDRGAPNESDEALRQRGEAADRLWAKMKRAVAEQRRWQEKPRRPDPRSVRP